MEAIRLSKTLRLAVPAALATFIYLRCIRPWYLCWGAGDEKSRGFGCDIHSAEAVLPECQDVEVSDAFRLHPEVRLEVVDVRAGRWLVVRGGVRMGNVPPPCDFTWAFVLRESPDGTRLLVRERYRYTRWWAPLLVEPVEALGEPLT